MAARVTDSGVKGTLYSKMSQISFSQSLLRLVVKVTSDLMEGQSERYAWLGTTASMREWIGERLLADPQAFDYQITNKVFESSLHIPINLVLGDKLGQVNELLNSLGDAYPLWILEMVAALLNSAATAKCFDGQAFFSTSHNYGKTGVFSNDITLTGNANPAKVTAYEAAIAINAAINQMRLLPDDQGRKIKNETMKEVAIVYQAGTVNSAAIGMALSQNQLSTGSGVLDNPLAGWKGILNIIPVSSGLINDTTFPNTKFGVFRTVADNGKPILFQENEKARDASVLSDPNSEYVFKNRGWAAGITTVGNAGLGLPSDAIRGNLAA